MGCLLKAKYFPSTKLLNAQLGNNPNFIWHSVWKSLSLISQGAYTRIVSGLSTSVWTDSWLPSTWRLVVTSDGPPDIEVLLVSDLIEIADGQRGYKTDLSGLDCVAILAVPLSSRNTTDS